MDLDLVLAIGHHLAVFTLVGAMAAEFVLLRPGLDGVAVGRLARLDAVYGMAALLVVVVGIMRLYWGAAGPDCYLGNQRLLGENGGVCRGGFAVDFADSRVLALAQGAGPGPRLSSH